MKKIGLTGGIGSGKTYVSFRFEKKDIPVFNVDEIAGAIMENDPEVVLRVIELFGIESYKNNKLNKKHISFLLFSNKEIRKNLHEILYPKIIEQLQDWYDGLEEINTDIALVECALIYEYKMQNLFDYVIHVWAPENIRIERVKQRNSITEKEIKKRISCQMDETKKMDLADFIIDNTGTKELGIQVDFILKKIKDGQK